MATLADAVANGAPGPMVADPRRPMPGTRLVREWEGIEHSVTVRADGFECPNYNHRPIDLHLG